MEEILGVEKAAVVKWRKGKSYEEIYGVERAAQLRVVLSMRSKERIGPRANVWKGGRVVDRRGYVLVYSPSYHRPRSTLYAPEHMLVAEKVLGRSLLYLGMNNPRNEEVHHINFNPSDNRKENLLICTRSYHSFLHGRIRARGLRDVFREESKKC